MSKRTASSGLGSLGSAGLTAASIFVVTAVSAVAGIVIAREFGRGAETDGFFAAYGVFIVLVLASYAVRVAVLPSLARARGEGRLAGEVAGHALALAVAAVPLLLLAEAAAEPIAALLTGQGPEQAQDAAVEALRWMVPAAVAHLFAALAASALAALDDYGTAALGYGLGSALGLALILVRVDEDGLVAVSWGMALNGAVALAVPVGGLAVRAARARMPAAAVRPSGPSTRTRLGVFAAATSLPLALQGLYVVCLPFAGREGVGAQTSLAYAYLAASALVSVTASSLGLVSSVPLTRTGASRELVARHVVSASWLALALIGAAAGVFALAGPEVVEGILGDAYGGAVGGEVGRLVVVFSPWMAASVGVGLAFPLVFVIERTRALPWIGAGALAVQVPLAWAAQVALGLDGLPLALALSTALVLAGLLRELGAVAVAARGFAAGALVTAAIATVAFAPFALVGPVLGGVLGVFAYAVLLLLLRPRGLISGWRHLRALS